MYFLFHSLHSVFKERIYSILKYCSFYHPKTEKYLIIEYSIVKIGFSPFLMDWGDRLKNKLHFSSLNPLWRPRRRKIFMVIWHLLTFKGFIWWFKPLFLTLLYKVKILKMRLKKNSSSENFDLRLILILGQSKNFGI